MTAQVSLHRLAFVAYGRPVPQGTVRSLGKGRPSIHGNAATLLPWRQTIAGQAAAGATDAQWERTDRPVNVRAQFFFDRPMGHFTKTGLRSSAPAVPFGRGVGDLDKLCRGLLDAISDSGAVWLDDCQVVNLHAEKRYVPTCTHLGLFLDRPGVMVTVEVHR